MNSTIQVTEVDVTTTVIVLAGDQDTTTCSDFLEYATAVLDRCDRLLVDLSAVSFIDSMMLSTLLRVFGFAEAPRSGFRNHRRGKTETSGRS